MEFFILDGIFYVVPCTIFLVVNFFGQVLDFFLGS
jgi:hypothetical protein